MLLSFILLILSLSKAEIANLERAARPRRISENSFQRKFRHHSNVTGQLTVIDYGFVLQPDVVQLDDAVDIVCASNTSTLLLSMPAGATTISLLRKGAVLFGENTSQCVHAHHRVLARGVPFVSPVGDLLLVNLTVEVEQNSSSYLNDTEVTFFHGPPEDFDALVASNQTIPRLRGLRRKKSARVYNGGLRDWGNLQQHKHTASSHRHHAVQRQILLSDVRQLGSLSVHVKWSKKLSTHAVSTVGGRYTVQRLAL